jgi:hypothetical protein
MLDGAAAGTANCWPVGALVAMGFCAGAGLEGDAAATVVECHQSAMRIASSARGKEHTGASQACRTDSHSVTCTFLAGRLPEGEKSRQVMLANLVQI